MSAVRGKADLPATRPYSLLVAERRSSRSVFQAFEGAPTTRTIRRISAILLPSFSWGWVSLHTRQVTKCDPLLRSPYLWVQVRRLNNCPNGHFDRIRMDAYVLIRDSSGGELSRCLDRRRRHVVNRRTHRRDRGPQRGYSHGPPRKIRGVFRKW